MVYLCNPDIEVIKVLYCMQSEAAFLRTLHGKTRFRRSNNNNRFWRVIVLSEENANKTNKSNIIATSAAVRIRPHFACSTYSGTYTSALRSGAVRRGPCTFAADA